MIHVLKNVFRMEVKSRQTMKVIKADDVGNNTSDARNKRSSSGFFKALPTSKKSKRIASRQSFTVTFSSVGQTYP
jgi:hypothetical protein